MPHERSLVEQLVDYPFELIGVNGDDDLEEIREKVKAKNINWRSFQNQPSADTVPISAQWNTAGWPTICLLDADGVIRFKNPEGKEIDAAIEQLLGEMGHEVKIESH